MCVGIYEHNAMFDVRFIDNALWVWMRLDMVWSDMMRLGSLEFGSVSVRSGELGFGMVWGSSSQKLY